MRLDDRELECLLIHGESFRVECKETSRGDSPNAIREAVCAFANDLPGSGQPGVIFVGVNDNRRPTGFEISDEILRQLSDIKTDGLTVPPPSMFVEKRRLRGFDIAVVTVVPSDSPPIRYRGGIHVRIGPRRGLATAQDERILNERRRAAAVPFDIQPVPGTTLSDLNLRQFGEDYLPRAFDPEILDTNERSEVERLAATKMIASADDATPTILGLQTLGKSPRDYLTNAYVQFLRINGTGLADPIIDEESIDGSLGQMLRRCDDKLKAHNRTAVDLTTAVTERRVTTYPLPTLQQIARNAIMHRTYEGTNAPVRITWFNDRIEIQSPGGPFGNVTPGNFGRAGVTDYRNPNLSDAMKVLGFVQRFGVGIAIARSALRDEGHADPEFLVDEPFVTAIIGGKQN